MHKLLKYCTIITLLGAPLIVAPESFIKKKKQGPTMTECCDLGVDLLETSAGCAERLGALGQKLIRISRDAINGDKKSFLPDADKAQLKEYFDKTQQCKQALEQAQTALDSYIHYLDSCECS